MSEKLVANDLLERAEITDTILNYATGIDRRDWARFRSIFMPEIGLEFTTWSGAPRTRIHADDWVANVTAGLSGFDATQHSLTNFVITLRGDEATAVVYMNAHHYLVEDGKREMQSIGGYYTHQLVKTAEGWKIADCMLTVTWEMGDRALFGRAAERLAA